jgi:hypothetical protein
MSGEVPEWLKLGRGTPPRLRWSISTDAPLAAMELARESGEVLAADASGGLYLLNRRGRLSALTRSFDHLTALAWSDVGTHFAAVVGESQLSLVDRKFKPLWSLELPETIVGLAMSPHGGHLAVGLAGGRAIVFDEARRQVARFETSRPLRFLRFLASRPALIGAAEYGLLCARQLDGGEVWSTPLWSNSGDLSVTGDGSSIFLAGFNQGVQVFDSEGESRGAYVVDGTPDHVSTSFMRRRLAVSTLERHFYWLDTAGTLRWATALPDAVRALRCDPSGSGVVCAMEGGRIVRLDWTS